MKVEVEKIVVVADSSDEGDGGKGHYGSHLSPRWGVAASVNGMQPFTLEKTFC